jgi:ribosomal protein S6--L-glutamate ligase
MRIGILAEIGMPETVGLVDAVHEAGHTPHVIHYPGMTVATGGEHAIRLLGDPDITKVDYVIPYNDRHILTGNRILSALISIGIPSYLQPEKILTARNKHLAQLAFAKAGIPHPASVAVDIDPSPDPKERGERFDELMDYVEPDTEKKLVVKALYGTKGEDVWLKDRKGARIKADELNQSRQEFMFQQAIPLMPEEIRATDKGVLVCGGELVTAFRRIAKEGDFRANIAQGATAERYDPTDEEVEMALTASEKLSICFGRLDIIDSLQGPQALEFNVFPGHEIIKVTRKKVPSIFIAHALEKYEEIRADLEANPPFIV